MGFVSWIIVGIAAGWLAEIITGTRRMLAMNLLLGSIGGLIAGWITNHRVGGDAGMIASIIVAAFAAVALVVIANVVAGRR